MVAALICREYGWTYQEYMEQPQTFLLTIISLLDEEARELKRRNK